MRMSEVDWSTSAVKYLMKEYQKREELWNRDHNLYRVQSAKNSAWVELSNIFSCDVADLRKKFNSILASYRRERTKVKEGGRSTWFLYQHMKFLPGYTKQDDYQDEEDQNMTLEEPIYRSFDIETDETHASEERDGEEVVLIKHEPESELYAGKRYIKTASHGKKRLTRTLKRKVRRQPPLAHADSYSKAYVDGKILELQRKMRSDTSRNKDDCDTYGEYIASMLRKHDNKTQCMIKQAINNILFEQEMNKYENPLDNDMVAEMLDPSDE